MILTSTKISSKHRSRHLSTSATTEYINQTVRFTPSPLPSLSMFHDALAAKQWIYRSHRELSIDGSLVGTLRIKRHSSYAAFTRHRTRLTGFSDWLSSLRLRCDLTLLSCLGVKMEESENDFHASETREAPSQTICNTKTVQALRILRDADSMPAVRLNQTSYPEHGTTQSM